MAEEIIEQGYRELADTILEHNPGVDLGRVRAAFELADRAHSGQKRKAGTPYVTHCVAAAQICAEMGLDEDSIVAALLHDCIEDTAITHEDIARQFGAEVADIVEGVTKLTRVQFTSREDEQMENLRKMLMAMAKDIRVILIKIADRLHNMRTMEYMVTQKQLEKSLETMEIYAPIAHRLGLQKVKWELEDLSLKYLDPDGYREIITYLDSKADVLNKFMSDVEKKITDRLTEYSIHATVQSRIKHTYSIYRKMYTQKRGLDEIFDLCAFRVIVDDIPDCYNVLGHIHDMFRPVPGRFKDYIATPKPNGYQSVHTTVLGEEGIMFEVQIRTWEMHRISEYGSAAHWKYKSGGAGVRAGDEEKFAWIRRLLEAQQDTDAQDFVHDLKMDMFNDEVFVFTPKGDLLKFPKGSTVLDFAYHIHSGVGNKCVGGKINGRNVSFREVLHSGDTIEILTQNNQTPKQEWLNIVQSSRAKSKIRLALKELKVKDGVFAKEMLERKFKNRKIELEESVLYHLISKMGFKETSDFYRQLVDEKIDINDVVDGYIAEKEHGTNQKMGAAIRSAEEFVLDKDNNANNFRTKSSDDELVIDRNLKGVDYSLAQCCHPIYGDQIFGFVTVNGGIKIHCQDCPNAPELRKRFGYRIVKARWSGKGTSQYNITLRVVGNDDLGIVNNITSIISKEQKIVMKSINIDSHDGLFSGNLNVLIDDTSKLDALLKKLRTVKGVKSVTRL